MSDEAESEIYRVNKLLAIEDLDWANQLEKAVGFLFNLDLDFPQFSWMMIQNNWFPFFYNLINLILRVSRIVA